MTIRDVAARAGVSAGDRLPRVLPAGVGHRRDAAARAERRRRAAVRTAPRRPVTRSRQHRQPRPGRARHRRRLLRRGDEGRVAAGPARGLRTFRRRLRRRSARLVADDVRLGARHGQAGRRAAAAVADHVRRRPARPRRHGSSCRDQPGAGRRPGGPHAQCRRRGGGRRAPARPRAPPARVSGRPRQLLQPCADRRLHAHLRPARRSPASCWVPSSRRPTRACVRRTSSWPTGRRACSPTTTTSPRVWSAGSPTGAYPCPRRRSVVGFDDTALASMISPRLTTVHLPVAEAGEVAVGLLLDLLQGLPPRTRPVELPVELIVRSSTGTAPEVMTP